MNITYSKPLILLIFILLVSACSDDPPRLRQLLDGDKILAFGDSLTYGTGARITESYPRQLQRLSGFSVVNEGVPGEISADGVIRLASVLAKHEPKLVILCHGGNDFLRKLNPTQTEINLKAMVNQIRESGAQVILIGVPKPGLFLSAAKLYSQVASELSVPVDIDILPTVLSDNNLKSDAIHPNRLGYKQLAEEIDGLLRKTGAY